MYIYIYIYIYTYIYVNHNWISNHCFILVLRVSCLTQSFSQLNKIYKRKRKNYNIVVSINLKSSQSFVSYLTNAYFNWCQNFNTTLFLLFNRLCSLYAALSNYSFKHNRHYFVCGLYGSHVLTNFH